MFCLLFFIVSRLYLLPQTLYFWGDIGRDHQVLIEMVQEKKPVLLGPGNSQLPFNQSAWYYYLNLPIFILSGYSAYTTTLTGIALFTGAIILSSWIRSKKFTDSSLINTHSIFLLFLTFHPLLLEQQRYTWNPAFAVAFIVVAVALFDKLLQYRRLSIIEMGIFGISLSFAAGMTYACIPLVGMLVLISLFRLHIQQGFLLLGSLILGMIIVFVPHLVFEVRHNFVLTSQLLHASDTTPMLTFSEKLSSGILYTLGFGQLSLMSIVAFIGVVLLICVGVITFDKEKRANLLIQLGIILSVLLISILGVKQYNSHYSLVVGAIFFYCCSQLSSRIRTGLIALLALLWIPSITVQFQQKPHRTVEDLERCARLVCAENKDAMYVSGQAWHGYHTGYDYSFFFNKNGCYTRDIVTNPYFSAKMAVVVDRTSFDMKTDYHELSLFGEKTLLKKYVCTPELSVVILQQKM